MSHIAEDLAGRYAIAVVDVLTGDFPQLQDLRTRLMAIGQIGEHAQNPDTPFEMSIDFTRNWRLHREDAFKERWRVLLHCHKDRWTEEDIRFSDSVNARLRAIKLED